MRPLDSGAARSRRALFAVVVVLLALPAMGSVMAVQSAPIFSPASWSEKRGSFSMLPFEAIDMVTGGLTLTFEDLVLSGNAGMDLRMVRVYGTGGDGGAYGFGPAGVPLAVSPAVSDVVAPIHPVLHFVGSTQRMVPESSLCCDDVFLTADFWRYRNSTRTLQMSNGWTATYLAPASAGQRALLDEVHDGFGNSIDASWNGGVLSSVTQTVSGNSRTVNLTYDSAGFTMSYHDGTTVREWRYQATATGYTYAAGAESRIAYVSASCTWTMVDPPPDRSCKSANRCAT